MRTNLAQGRSLLAFCDLIAISIYRGTRARIDRRRCSEPVLPQLPQLAQLSNERAKRDTKHYSCVCGSRIVHKKAKYQSVGWYEITLLHLSAHTRMHVTKHAHTSLEHELRFLCRSVHVLGFSAPLYHLLSISPLASTRNFESLCEFGYQSSVECLAKYIQSTQASEMTSPRPGGERIASEPQHHLPSALDR